MALTNTKNYYKTVMHWIMKQMYLEHLQINIERGEVIHPSDIMH